MFIFNMYRARAKTRMSRQETGDGWMCIYIYTYVHLEGKKRTRNIQHFPPAECDGVACFRCLRAILFFIYYLIAVFD